MPIEKVQYNWNVYPIGTKVFAVGGGYWEKNKNGWKWCTGATFHTPGGDINGLVEIPEYPRLLTRGDSCTPPRFWEYAVAYGVELEYRFTSNGYVLSTYNKDREKWAFLLTGK